MLTTYAVVVTDSKAPNLVMFMMSKFNLNVSDDLAGVVQSYRETREVPYGILHVSRIDQSEFAKFYVIGSESFHRNYQQSGDEFYGPFLPVTEI